MKTDNEYSAVKFDVNISLLHTYKYVKYVKLDSNRQKSRQAEAKQHVFLCQCLSCAFVIGLDVVILGI